MFTFHVYVECFTFLFSNVNTDYQQLIFRSSSTFSMLLEVPKVSLSFQPSVHPLFPGIFVALPAGSFGLRPPLSQTSHVAFLSPMIFVSQMPWFPVAQAVDFCLCQDELGWLELNVGCEPSGASLGVHVCSRGGCWCGGAGGCAARLPRDPAGRCWSQRQGKAETGGPQRPPTSSA